MARRRTENVNEIRYSDSILTQNIGMVRVTELDPDTELKIAGRWIVAADIPLNIASLSCGHIIRGIALKEGNVVFCETCKDQVFATDIS